MRRLRVIIMIVVVLLVSTGCVTMESNYNKFEQKLIETQNNLKIDVGVSEESFYYKNLIRDDQKYGMPEYNYLIYYFIDGDTPKENDFKDLVEYYREDKDSLVVYTVKTDDIRLEFVTRKQKVYTIEDVWFNASEAEYLPYKVK